MVPTATPGAIIVSPSISPTREGSAVAKSKFSIFHVARQQVGLQEEEWRGLLQRVAGKRSLKDMTDRELDLVMKELKRLGFKAQRPTGFPTSWAKSPKAYVNLIHALWRECAGLGVVQNGSDQALAKFCAGVIYPGNPAAAVVLDLLSFQQASPVIEALKVMKRRGKAA